MLPVGITARYFTANDFLGQGESGFCMFLREACIGFAPLGNDLIGIDRIHAVIRSSMKHNHWHASPFRFCESAAHDFKSKLPLPGWIGPASFHGSESFGGGASGSEFRSGEDREGGEKIGIGCGKNGGHRTTGRDARNVHSIWIDVVSGANLANNGCENRRFTGSTLLVFRAKPIPTLQQIGSA